MYRNSLFSNNWLRSAAALFVLFFIISILLPVPGFIVHIVLSRFFAEGAASFVTGFPKFIGALIDGLVGAIVLSLTAKFSLNSAPASRRVMITVGIIVLVAALMLIVDQFYAIPLP